MSNKASKTITKAAQFTIDMKPSATLINRKFAEIKSKTIAIDDARLAIAIELTTMQAQCETSHINFKKWCESSITQSWQTVRKLLPVGEAEAKEEGTGIAVLTEMREKNKTANQLLRDNKKDSTTPAAKTPKKETKGQKIARLQAERAKAEASFQAAFQALDIASQTAFLAWANAQATA